ncbi:PhnA domain-containing protein [Neptunicella sp. SCSIO 80796]|uniref:PhnA domain-containing protein n=1 Tax=Neptunicella plasticusilytica TaxID=3117012 RepID=UPI003A4DE601
MSVSPSLLQRSDNKCELCASVNALTQYELPYSAEHSDNQIVVCSTCHNQITQASELDTNHWRCLNDSMWSPVPAVQVMAWRMLKQLGNELWAQDLLDMLYLDEDTRAWAEAGVQVAEDKIIHLDSNGAVLQAGDTVTITKDLNVKGTSFVAKRGTAVRNIALTDNPEHIEGKVNGTRIVILTCYTKKSG